MSYMLATRRPHSFQLVASTTKTRRPKRLRVFVSAGKCQAEPGKEGRKERKAAELIPQTPDNKSLRRHCD